MTVLSLSHLILTDVLDELGIKPFWEQVRSHLMAVSAAAALFILYIMTETQLTHCLPNNENGSQILDDAQVDFVDTYCANHLSVTFRSTGIAPVALVLALNIASSLWLYFPKVVSSFDTFVKAVKLIDGFHLTPKKLKEQIVLPAAEDEKRLLLQRACRLLLNFKDSHLIAYYICHSIAVLLVVFVAIGWSGWLWHWLAHDNHHLECEINSEDLKELLHALNTDHFFCTYSLAKLLLPFYIFFCITFGVQCFPIFVGMCMAMNILCCNNSEVGNTSYRFVRMFWKYSRPTNVEAFDEVVKFVHSKEVAKKIRESE